MKKLPTGNQSFDEIINKGFLYADKTAYIHRLLQSDDRNYFLSRPRRFGKTLLISTLHELFAGNDHLFQGLAIEKLGYKFPKHPVLFLSLSSDGPGEEILNASILGKLREIAIEAGLDDQKINDATCNLYFAGLIKALGHNSNSKIAILIDEYDAPVTTYMENYDVAQANAKILHNFFAILKDMKVSKHILFTLVTGITRYALTSMDSGPNHLVDISLNPEYAGICGFTLDEFELLFADRMETTLAKLKEAGTMKPTASLEDLKREIYHWYDGYSWDGQTKVLNPYSMLFFFRNNKFDNYWVQSGRPSHLTAMIKSNPYDFVNPKLDSYLSDELKKTELTGLKTTPVLFHSGYLTVDKISNVSIPNPATGLGVIMDSYSFKLPNSEVSTSYYRDCFSIVFGVEPNKGVALAKRSELLEGFLTKDAKKVSEVFNFFLTKISYYQRPKNEKEFHKFVQLILVGMNFKILSEIPGYANRLDLYCFLSDDVSLIIELKYCYAPDKLSLEDKNGAMAKEALSILPLSATNKALAEAVIARLDTSEYRTTLIKIRADSSGGDENDIFADMALNFLTKSEYNLILASTIEPELTDDRKKEIFKSLALLSQPAENASLPSEEKIEDILTKACLRALRDITERRYLDTVGHMTRSVISLGMAVYGNVPLVKVIFDENPAPRKAV
ncbi:MAG: AAA family ATPase [Deltaproteobacteria bacterium]|jgi:hypothetical protein|nr:AAA family ATPase [Deltaproteobacteria bacterium]